MHSLDASGSSIQFNSNCTTLTPMTSGSSVCNWGGNMVASRAKGEGRHIITFMPQIYVKIILPVSRVQKGFHGFRTPLWQPRAFFEPRSCNVLFVCSLVKFWCNILSQLLFHVASKNLTKPFPRCTSYTFLIQKVLRMQRKTPFSALKI